MQGESIFFIIFMMSKNDVTTYIPRRHAAVSYYNNVYYLRQLLFQSEVHVTAYLSHMKEYINDYNIIYYFRENQ